MDEFKESGFNDRFLFYYSEAEMPRLMDGHRYSNQEKLRVEVSMNEKARLLVEKQFELRAKYNEKLSKGENPWQRIRVLEIQGQARERLYKFTDAIMHSKAYKEYGSKAGNFISRIALILTIFKNPKIENEGLIELAEIESAIEIWKFYYYKYTQLFSTSDEIEVLKGAIISFIENHTEFKATGKIRRNRIWQNFSKMRSRKPLFERAIAELLEEEELIQLDSSNPRSKIYTIPPPE